MRSWQVQEAKANLSELLRKAESEGPQGITHHGRPVGVLLSSEAFARLSGQRATLVDFMQASPLAALNDDELLFERDSSPTRDVAM